MQNTEHRVRIRPGLAQLKARFFGDVGESLDCILMRIFCADFFVLREEELLTIDRHRLVALTTQADFNPMMFDIVMGQMLELICVKIY